MVNEKIIFAFLDNLIFQHNHDNGLEISYSSVIPMHYLCSCSTPVFDPGNFDYYLPFKKCFRKHASVQPFRNYHLDFYGTLPY